MNTTSKETHPHLFVESSLPQDQQKHIGWYWDAVTKKFYRWDNLPKGN